MVYKKVLLRLGVTGGVMLAGGVTISFWSLASSHGVYTSGPIALMGIGVIVASLGYGFLYLVHHLKKTERYESGKAARSCFN